MDFTKGEILEVKLRLIASAPKLDPLIAGIFRLRLADPKPAPEAISRRADPRFRLWRNPSVVPCFSPDFGYNFI